MKTSIANQGTILGEALATTPDSLAEKIIVIAVDIISDQDPPE